MASERPLKLAVFGKPVTQSLSPRIHRLFAAQCGLNIDYQAIEATRESFPGLVTRLAKSGGRGCNITVPLKREAWKLAGRCSESAARAQAANTLVFDGSWYADSTDGPGLVNDLKSLPGCQLKGARLCLAGAGGAAASVLGALLDSQPEFVFIANRTRDRAMQLARTHARFGSVEYGTFDELENSAPFDVLINATSMGHEGGTIRLSPTWFKAQGFCYDMNYSAAAKPLRDCCREKAIRYVDGLGMLVRQAALSFTLWTGQSPDAAAVLQTLRDEAG